ncbi:MAG: RluA family pseudouridine synthase [Syntrophotaleaceae bacterium]
MQRFTFDRARRPERLDLFLAETLPELTRSQLKRLIDEGRVTLDDKAVKAGARLKGGETVTVVSARTGTCRNPFASHSPDRSLRGFPAHRHRQAGRYVVHPAPGMPRASWSTPCCITARTCRGSAVSCAPASSIASTRTPPVATKTDAAHQGLARQFKDHSINRRYIALVYGLLPSARGTVDKSIGRHATQRKKMSTGSRSGRRAVTHWKVLQAWEEDRLSLVELRLETGRTHQIRVHLADLKHGVVGDPVYGGNRCKSLKDPELRRLISTVSAARLCTQGCSASFIPTAASTWRCASEVPQDMQTIIDYS